ncbi:MAG: DUF4112 domain-containing protein [Kofleriaceae bacterium]
MVQPVAPVLSHGTAHRGELASLPPELEGVRTLTRVLDHYLVDPVLGLLLPGVGDLVGSLIGLYVVVIAVRRKVSPVVIARMLLNLAIDAGIGVVPIVGDLADLAFKANAKNFELLVARHETGKASAKDWLAVGGALLVFVAVLGLASYAIVAIVRAIA